jgi:hypothetical protein
MQRLLLLTLLLTSREPNLSSSSGNPEPDSPRRRRKGHNFFRASQFDVADATADGCDADTGVATAPSGAASSAARQEALELIRGTYPSAYSDSAMSHHFFVRLAPPALQASISKFVWTSESIQSLAVLPSHGRCRQQMGQRHRIVPDVYHEIYLMRHEADFLDEHKAHYDGILKIPGLHTLRSLTYLEGRPATFVAATSGLNYTTHAGSTIVIDFNRELHFAILPALNDPTTETRGSSPTATPPRVIIKAAVHVFDCQTPVHIAILYIVAHRVVFFGIKSVRNAFESSESRFLMVLDNALRFLNKVHMFLPILAVTLPLGLISSASIRSPLQCLPYILYIAVLVHPGSGLSLRHTSLLRLLATVVAMGRTLFLMHWSPRGCCTVWTLLTKWLFHFAWLGICGYFLLNAEMARCILLAPIPEPIEINN